MAKSSFGGTVKLTGESEYKKALNDIVSSLKVMSSEMQIVTATYGKNDKSIQGLSERNQVLNRQIETQKERVEVLTNALEQSKTETGENSITTQKWQTELNKATAQLVSMEKEVKDNEQTMKQSSEATEDNAEEIKELGNESDKAGRKVFSLGDIIKANLISDVIKKGISELVDGMKKLGSTFVDIGKQALSSYADYEQLVGGVETLFGANGAKSIEEYAKSVGKGVDDVKDEFDKLMQSQDLVIANADKAYKTAGLSANQYMETVTSFSASLLQSLSGDTVQTAKVADMAITDMSDNANKMGTDMSLIQSAYQGFAKQNYTMLDNLKLGYGGTKTEMARLLADAEKLSGVKYDISNLSDIYNAIHVIQTDLKISGLSYEEAMKKVENGEMTLEEATKAMGTTAKEASSTIQGSVSSLKSAWSNMLVGIANDNADFEGLVNNLIDSVITALNNIIPRIEIIVGGIGEMIISFADKILPKLLEVGVNAISNLVNGMSSNMPRVLESVNNIISSLIGGLSSILPQISNVAVQVIMQLVNTIIQNLPQIIECGIQVLLSLIDGLVKTIPDLIPTIVSAVITIVETLIDHLDEIIDAGIEIIFALIDGIINALPELIDKMPVIIDKLIIAITNNLPKLIQAGITLTVKLAEGLIKAIPQMVSKIPEIINSLQNGLLNYVYKIKDVGKELISGLWSGIKEKWDGLKQRVEEFGNGIVKKFKSVFGIHSPSKVMREEVGSNLALGIGEGFSETMENVTKDMANAIPNNFDTSINSNINTNSNSLNAVGSFNPYSYNGMVDAFKQALSEVKVMLGEREMGTFITNTVEEAVYS